jgi:hypothetical protein
MEVTAVFIAVHRNSSIFDSVVTFTYLLMQTQIEIMLQETKITTPQTQSTTRISNPT